MTSQEIVGRRWKLFFLWSIVIILSLGIWFSSRTRNHTTPAGYNPTRICANQYDQDIDHTNSKENHFTIKLTEGCFSGLIKVPTWWKYYTIDAAGDAKDYWIAYWREGQPGGSNVLGPNDRYDFPPGLFRVQGHGTAVFYTNAHYIDAKSGTHATESVDASKLTEFQLDHADPHLCQKPDDAYFASYGPATPMPAGSGEFHNPDFQFDDKHHDRKVSWANGFTGKITVCLVVDGKGNPTNVTFPQSPGADMEAHIKEHISGWKYKPGWYTESYRDKDPKYVPTQMAFEFRFP